MVLWPRRTNSSAGRASACAATEHWGERSPHLRYLPLDDSTTDKQPRITVCKPATRDQSESLPSTMSLRYPWRWSEIVRPQRPSLLIPTVGVMLETVTVRSCNAATATLR